jgi:D-3-phosphoglycerate dehydrogenase
MGCFAESPVAPVVTRAQQPSILIADSAKESRMPEQVSVAILGEGAALDRLYQDIESRLTRRRIASLRRATAQALLTTPMAADAVEVVLAPGSMRFGGEEIARLPRLRALVSPVTGVEAFDRGAASEAGVMICNGQCRENVESLAEATILLTLAALYDLPATQAVLRDDWRRRPFPPRARMLAGKTVGLVGYGAAGQAVARRLRPWRVRICAAARRPMSARGIDLMQLPELMQRSDVVMVLASASPENRHMIGEGMLRSMKTGAVLVNTGRGELIDEAALVRVSQARPDLRFALDVFETEPLPAEASVRGLSGAILTPHMVAHTAETLEALPGLAVSNIAAVLAGRRPPGLRNPEVLEGARARAGAISRSEAS